MRHLAGHLAGPDWHYAAAHVLNQCVRSTYVLKQFMGEPLIYRCVLDTFSHFCSSDFRIHVYYVKLIKSGPKIDPERGGPFWRVKSVPAPALKNRSLPIV